MVIIVYNVLRLGAEAKPANDLFSAKDKHFREKRTSI